MIAATAVVITTIVITVIFACYRATSIQTKDIHANHIEK